MTHHYCKAKHIFMLCTVFQSTIVINDAFAYPPIVEKLYDGLIVAGKDQVHFYKPNNLIGMGSILAGMGIVANTSIDSRFRDGYQEYIRSPKTDAISLRVEPIGNQPFPHIIILTCASLNLLPDRFAGLPVINTFSVLGGRSLRIILTGGFPLSVFQRVLGSPRPSEGPSNWTPFRKATGMSGHTFLGSVPFLAVYSVSDKLWLRSIALAFSTFVGISRINDNKHYLSQVAGGWSMAFLAAHTIRNEFQKENKVSFTFLPQFIGISIKL